MTFTIAHNILSTSSSQSPYTKSRLFLICEVCLWNLVTNFILITCARRLCQSLIQVTWPNGDKWLNCYCDMEGSSTSWSIHLDSIHLSIINCCIMMVEEEFIFRICSLWHHLCFFKRTILLRVVADVPRGVVKFTVIDNTAINEIMHACCCWFWANLITMYGVGGRVQSPNSSGSVGNVAFLV